MKPVKQTLFGPERGNCFAACVASILELELDSVPNFAEHKSTPAFWDAVHVFLEEQGYRMISVHVPGALVFVEGWSHAFAIFSGDSPRDPDYMAHAVVGRIDGYSWEVVHDPHPDDAGISGKPIYIRFLVPRSLCPLCLCGEFEEGTTP